MIIAAVLAAAFIVGWYLVLPAVGVAHHGAGCHTTACHERVAADRCTQQAPRWCVRRAELRYRLDAGWRAWMRRVAYCESRWDPYARNASGAAGLYQFMPGTWATTPYGSKDVMSAKWAALAAAWMVTQGRAGEWACR